MQETQTDAVEDLVNLCEHMLEAMKNEGMRGTEYDHKALAAFAPNARAEVERLRTALVEERAALIGEHDVCFGDAREQARRELIAEGLLPTD